MKSYSLKYIAEYINADIIGDGNTEINGVATLVSATKGQLSFLDNPLYKKYLGASKASAVILSKDFLDKCKTNALLSSNPYLAYAKVAELFSKKPPELIEIHETACISPNAKIGNNVSIGPNTVIADGAEIADNVKIGSGCNIGQRVKIGENSQLYANISIYYDVTIGHNCIIHSGVVLGADGFGIAKNQGEWYRIPQIGAVTIGNFVDIGANTTIDRGAIENTEIGDGVKIDNQVQIGHNVKVGDHTAIAGCVGIAGSTKIGKHCIIGGAACINGHLDIVDNVVISGMSGVSRSITQPGLYSSGMPAQPNHLWHKNMVRLRHLDNLAKRVIKLERLVSEFHEINLKD